MNIFYLLNQFILGNFKWTLLGSLLTLSAMLAAYLINRTHKKKWLGIMIYITIPILFLWFGHNLIDPGLHAMASFWVTPLDEPMHIITR